MLIVQQNMSIFTVKDVINEIKQYCNDQSIVSLLLTCKASIIYLKDCEKQIRNQALHRELLHCAKNKKVKLNDRLCSYRYNYRVVKTNNS